LSAESSLDEHNKHIKFKLFQIILDAFTLFPERGWKPETVVAFNERAAPLHNRFPERGWKLDEISLK
jgi:hypothetical protein